VSERTDTDRLLDALTELGEAQARIAKLTQDDRRRWEQYDKLASELKKVKEDLLMLRQQTGNRYDFDWDVYDEDRRW